MSTSPKPFFLPRGVAEVDYRLDQRRPLGTCTSCYSSLPEEPILDARLPWARFCSTGCRNDFIWSWDD